MRTPLLRRAWLLPFLSITMMIALVPSGPELYAQTTVTLVTVDGNEFRGKMVEEGTDAVRMQTEAGVEVKIPRTQIARIVYGEADVATRPTEYAELGGSFGTPSGLNVMAGYNFGRVGARFSGMYLGALLGIELDAVFSLSDPRKDVVHSLYAGPGLSDLGRYGEWAYIGAGYTVNIYGFHGQIGLSVGQGDFSSPQLMFQLGYMHRFR